VQTCHLISFVPRCVCVAQVAELVIAVRARVCYCAELEREARPRRPTGQSCTNAMPSRSSSSHLLRAGQRFCCVFACLALCTQAVQSFAFDGKLPSALAARPKGRSLHPLKASSCAGISGLMGSSLLPCEFFFARDGAWGKPSGKPACFSLRSSRSRAFSHPLVWQTVSTSRGCAASRSVAQTALQAARRSGSAGRPGDDDWEDPLGAQWEAELRARSPMRDLRAARGVVRDPWEDKQMKRVDFPRSTR
jgi:hypothetical protein